MAFQTTVKQKLAVGVVGDFYDDSPRRVDPYTISSSDAGSIGCAYTVDTTDPSKVVLGGTGVFAGIAINSKEFVRHGLNASIDFKQYDEIEACSMGRIWLSIADDVTVGMAAFYNETTGAVIAGTSGSTISDYVEIPNSKFVLVDASATEPMVVLQLG